MKRSKSSGRTGVWLIGARGGLATTVVAGAAMMRRGLAGTTGLLSALPPFDALPGLPAIDDLVFGGHEVHASSLVDSARAIDAENHSLGGERLNEINADLEAAEANIRPGTVFGCGPAIRRLASSSARKGRSARDHVEAFRSDVLEFKKREGLDRVVVVNLASTEPPCELEADHRSLAGLERLIDGEGEGTLRASTLYAYAALRDRHPFVNFTPSNGASLPALIKLAKKRKVPLMGSDGKTGETLVKSALAPLFVMRNLQVLSWVGYNILGDGDGRILAEKENKRAKIESKDSLLPSILGYEAHTGVSIDYVPSLGDLKTAWDFIHFSGFLGHRMSLQFIWQGCDAILAAPLVLDLVRLITVADIRGESGLQPQLGCFFKSPEGVDEQDLATQYRKLVDYACAILEG